MSKPFEHREHLVRMALLFGAGVLIFLAVRAVLVPKGFGMYGHFRGPSVEQIRALPVHFAGAAACAECHQDEAGSKHGTESKRVGCESCHGALAAHAADPAKNAAAKLDAAVLCVRCHQENRAKPKHFPQIDPAKHQDGEACAGCHDPHAPAL